MQYKILESLGVEIENTDDAAFNNFLVSGESGIIKGVLDECKLVDLFGTVAIAKGELMIQGFRIKITEAYQYTPVGSAASRTNYHIVARLTLHEGGDVSFNIVTRTITELQQDDLHKLSSGIHEVELAQFTHYENQILKLTPSIGFLTLAPMLKPEFANSISDMTDPKSLYVLDGYIYAYQYQEGETLPNYINQIPISTDASGAIYGADYNKDGVNDGYQEGVRFGSSGTDKPNTPTDATGFIPVKYKQTVYLANCQILKDATYNQFAVYKSDKSTLIALRNITGVMETYWGGAFDSNNYLTQIKMCDESGAFDLSEAEYVRFTGNNIDANSIISVEKPIEETVTEGGYQWVNTGHAFIPTDYGEEITNLGKRIERNARDISKIEETVEEIKNELETNEKPQDVPEYVKTEAVEVANKVIANRTANSLVLLMATDLHIVASSDTTFDDTKTAIKHLGMGMAEIRKHTRPDAVVLLGDYVYNVTPLNKEEAKTAMEGVIESLYEATNGVPSIWLDGNHDYYENTKENKDYRLTDGEHYALVGANNSQEVEVDPDNLVRNYGYIDFKKQRIRLIYLNTTDISGDVYSANYITNTQGQWLINTALNMSDKEDANKWGIVVCSHFPIHMYVYDKASQYYGTENFPDLKRVICAYKDKSSGTAYGTSYDFKSAKAELIATFHGHIHNFKVHDVATNGGNIVKAICIPNGCPYRENPYPEVFQEVDGSGNKVSYPKTAGTAEDTSFNAVVIDRDNSVIRAICYGAGPEDDREITY